MKTKPLGVRFNVRSAQLLARVCQLRGEDISDFIRRAVLTELAELSYLSDEEKKALGMLKDRRETGPVTRRESQPETPPKLRKER